MNEVARGEQLSQDGTNSLGFGCVFHFMATQFSLRIFPISQFEEVLVVSVILTAYLLLIITGSHMFDAGCLIYGWISSLTVSGSDNIEAALCFYKALKVYPTPSDLIGIYDKTVPKVCFLSR